MLLLLTLVTGLGSWIVATGVARPLTFAHAAAGLVLLLLVPSKLCGPVRTGFCSGRATRWVSATSGVVVLATIALGVLHSTGLWYRVGTWSAGLAPATPAAHVRSPQECARRVTRVTIVPTAGRAAADPLQG